MIECRYWGEPFWSELYAKMNLTPQELNFTDYRIRINGVIYTKNTKAFIEAYEKEIIWQKLQND